MNYIAHRGHSVEYRDNSIVSIREAIRRNYYGVEIDVQLCKTGEIIIFHDVYVGGRFISDLSLKELIPMGVCSLSELYEKVPEIKTTRLFLDIKGPDPKVVDALVEFYKHRSTKNVVFCSFNRNYIYALPSYYKIGTTIETSFLPDEYSIVTRGVDVVIIHWTVLTHDFISHCKSNDVKVYTYTHKEREELQYMRRYDVDGIITNGFRTGDHSDVALQPYPHSSIHSDQLGRA